MSLPSNLSVNLRRFQSAVHTTQRVMGDRNSYPSASVININLPRQGCLDISTLTLLADMYHQDAAAVSLTTPKYHSMMFRRVEFNIGGSVVSLQQLSDYGFAYQMSRTLGSTKARSDYQQQVSCEGSVALSSGAGVAGTTPLVLASEWLGLGAAKHCRFLPLDLLPEITLTIYLHDRSRWTTADNAAVDTLELRNARLVFKMVQFEDNMLSKLWAARLSSAPIVVPFENVSYYEGQATSSSATTYSAFVNGQSIDYVLAAYRKGDYDSSYANRWLSYAGHNTADVATQVSFNGSPITAWGLTPLEACLETQQSLGGSGNAGYSPDIANFGDFRDNLFAQIHRMKLDTDEVDGKGWITGTSTYGQAAEVMVSLANGDTNSKKPVIIIWSTGTLEISAGRQIAVAL